MAGRPQLQVQVQQPRVVHHVHDAQRQYHEHLTRKQSRRSKHGSLPPDSEVFRQTAYASIWGDMNKDDGLPEARTPRRLQHKRRYSAAPIVHYSGGDENHLKAPLRFLPPTMASTTVLAPRAAPSYHGASSEFYPLELDQPVSGYVGKTNHNAGRLPHSAAPAGFEKNALLHQKGGEGYPFVLNRPRKLSAATTVTVTPVTPSDGFDSRSRSSSWSSQTTVVSKESARYPTYHSDLGHRTPSPSKTVFPRTVKRQPGELFASLPPTVLSTILVKLRESHLELKSDSCSTCWMRDVCAMAVVSRKWHGLAQSVLYEDIQLNGSDSAPQKKRYKLSHSSRLILLRRSLRANPELASLVRSLKVPALPAGVVMGEYHDLVATLVMECPNFERLIGLHPRYDHSYSRLFHALSMRQNLKQMDWILDAPAELQVQQPRSRSGARPGSSSAKSAQMRARRNSGPLSGGLGAHEMAAFLEHHVNWMQLTTLTIHCLPGASLAPEGLVTKTLRLLPSLRHVRLSRLSPSAFNDHSLQALPALESLSLSHMAGVTSHGLSAFATLPSSQAMTRLTLRHVNLDSLPALVRIFSNLVNLRTFSLVQTFAPSLPEDTMIWLMPYLASSSLRRLHWDITTPSPLAHAADSILSRSIAANGFPALRFLRTPNDPEGVFQSLCQPVDRIETATDRFRFPGQNNVGLITRCGTIDSLTSLSTGSDSSVQSFGPRTPTSPSVMVLRETSDLRDARQAAQARLEAARHQPRFLVHVTDEEGYLVDEFSMAGHMGTIGSQIRYDLTSDFGARDEKGGLVDIDDVMAHCGEDTNEREGCTGRWNMSTNGNVDRKEKEKWWHSERGRWAGPQTA
ncbi:hypothetical protein F5X68DRAFT_259689 [Plectosphaerella plurivora]|uniref:F-box domain-containing protein n=1 Tax=Plectosphaerella plurivora TaxID=936078 RepID=A0A9P8VJ42_9PEZI|nr:hypothetical protein F5X68DRAFT_259689 [Plectosphaerella plurivora]